MPTKKAARKPRAPRPQPKAPPATCALCGRAELRHRTLDGGTVQSSCPCGHEHFTGPQGPGV